MRGLQRSNPFKASPPKASLLSKSLAHTKLTRGIVAWRVLFFYEEGSLKTTAQLCELMIIRLKFFHCERGFKVYPLSANNSTELRYVA